MYTLNHIFIHFNHKLEIDSRHGQFPVKTRMCSYNIVHFHLQMCFYIENQYVGPQSRLDLLCGGAKPGSATE